MTKAEAPFLGCPLADLSFDFILPDTLLEIREEAFSGASPCFVWIPDGVTAIGDNAFAGCEGLAGVRIPGSCLSIGENAFPADTVLFVEWNTEGETYAEENGYTYSLYSEGFNG